MQHPCSNGVNTLKCRSMLRTLNTGVCRRSEKIGKELNMMLEINKGTLLALYIGRMKDEGSLRPEQISIGKLNNAKEAIKVAREARTILGGNGVTLEYPVIRHANDWRPS